MDADRYQNVQLYLNIYIIQLPGEDLRKPFVAYHHWNLALVLRQQILRGKKVKVTVFIKMMHKGRQEQGKKVIQKHRYFLY